MPNTYLKWSKLLHVYDWLYTCINPATTTGIEPNSYDQLSLAYILLLLPCLFAANADDFVDELHEEHYLKTIYTYSFIHMCFELHAMYTYINGCVTVQDRYGIFCNYFKYQCSTYPRTCLPSRWLDMPELFTVTDFGSYIDKVLFLRCNAIANLPTGANVDLIWKLCCYCINLLWPYNAILWILHIMLKISMLALSLKTTNSKLRIPRGQ